MHGVSIKWGVVRYLLHRVLLYDRFCVLIPVFMFTLFLPGESDLRQHWRHELRPVRQLLQYGILYSHIF
jgi:hypothetical protein